MLPEFPSARRKMLELWNQVLFVNLHGSDPILAQIPVRVQKEGDSALLGGQEMEYKKCTVESSFPARDAEGMSFDEFFGSAEKLGHGLAAEQAKGIFAKLLHPTPHTMPITVEGQLTFQQLVETWGKMDVSFDKDGRPIWPSIGGDSRSTAELNENLPKWLQDPECQNALTELTERKRREFDEREARRRLVD